jgi:adenosylhomocysteine nucleosidase
MPATTTISKDPQFLILCPLKIEFKYFVSALEALGLTTERGVCEKNLPFVSVKEKNWVISIGGHGKVQFAVQTQYWLHNLENIKGVVCVGAAGALSADLKIGDIILADKTIEHDYREKFNTKAASPEFLADPELLKKMSEAKVLGFQVHVGSMASGDEDIVDHARATELVLQTGAHAVAWEGSGGAKACQFQNIPFLEVRAITDNARDGVADSFIKNIELCMKNAATLMASI